MSRLALDHHSGNHCGSTSLRDLSTYYGWGFDEPTCFGLGAGLGFSYLRNTGAAERMFFGRSRWLEWAFFERLDIEHQIHEGQPFAAAWADISDRIDAGDPVMIFTDLYYLDYYDSSTHFAPHSLLVVGYDDVHVHLADSEFDAIQTLPLDRLEAALTSDHVVPLQCRYLTIADGSIGTDTATAHVDAIRETASFMLDPASVDRPTADFGAQGVPAIREFAADLPTWTDLEDPHWAARFAYQNVERRGTGGGAFRAMYAAFLERAAQTLSLPADAPSRMAAIAADWTAVGEILYTASEADDTDLPSMFETAGDRVGALADREADLYADLLDGL